MWHQKTKMDKFTNFCTSVPWSKWDVPQVRRKCLQILLSDKGLVLRRYNERLQLRNKKTTQLINGQKPWIEGSYPVVNKHEKRGSALLVIRATQNKTIGDTCTATRRAVISKTDKTGSDRGAETGAFVLWEAALKNSLSVSSEGKFISWPPPRCILQRMKNLYPQGDLDADVPSSINSW